jgi:hypothetical protein
MRVRLLAVLVLAGLLLAGPLLVPSPVRAQEKASKPTLVLRLDSLDELIAHARYLASLSEQEEPLKQFEGLLKAKTGPKGLMGLDTKKPIGLYGSLQTELTDSQLVLMLPVSDEKAVLDFLEKLDFKAEKGKDGLYTVHIEAIPLPAIFRFANGYLYGTIKASEKQEEGLAKAGLPRPESILSAAPGDALVLTANLDAIPAPLKKMVVTQASLQLSRAADENPARKETEAQKEFRLALIDQAGAGFKSLVNDSETLTLRVQLDRKKHDIAATLTLQPRAGSDLARTIKGMVAENSVGASLGASEAAMRGSLYLALPERLRKTLADVFKEGFQAALAKESNPEARKAASALRDAFEPTASSGVFDLGFAFQGPGKGGRFTIVGGARVEGGAKFEKALEDALAKLPADKKKELTLNADKAEGVNIHKVTPDRVDDYAKQVLGDGPFYFAIREDAVLFTLGENALGALKNALARKPALGQPAEVELNMAGVARLMAREQKAAPEIANKVFTEKGSDRIVLRVEAGGKLEVKLSTKAQVLAFGALLDKARKER